MYMYIAHAQCDGRNTELNFTMVLYICGTFSIAYFDRVAALYIPLKFNHYNSCL